MTGRVAGLKPECPVRNPAPKPLVELTDKAGFYASTLPLSFDEKAQSLVAEGRDILEALVERLAAVDDWTEQNVEDCVRGYAEDAGLKLGKAAQPLRAALTGAGQSPEFSRF